MSLSNRAMYDVAQQKCVWYEHPDRGVLRLTGRDCTDLLHRVTTNDLNRLQPGEGAETLWLNRQGRLLESITLYVQQDAVLAVTSPGRSECVQTRLSRSIFFGDDLQIEDLTAQVAVWNFYGPRTADVAAAIGSNVAKSETLHTHQTVTVGDSSCVIARERERYQGGLTCLVPHPAREALRKIAESLGVVPIHETIYEITRIEHGIPRMGAELGETMIPLEAGLKPLISSSKGCYVGQEVIARMVSRGKLTRRLCGLKLDRMAPASTDLFAAGQSAGLLTSSVESPRFGPIGLGLIRTGWTEIGQQFHLTASGATAEVVPLPFV